MMRRLASTVCGEIPFASQHGVREPRGESTAKGPRAAERAPQMPTVPMQNKRAVDARTLVLLKLGPVPGLGLRARATATAMATARARARVRVVVGETGGGRLP